MQSLLPPHTSSSAMDIDHPSAPVPQVARNRSYSHQVHSNSASSLGVVTAGSHHRSNFEFNLEDHIKKTRKAATYLKQILHSQQCGGQCGSSLCRRIVGVLSHLDACEDDFCAVGGCSTTKRLLRHRRECTGVSSGTPTRSHSNSVATASYSETPRTSVDSGASSSSTAPTVVAPFSSLNLVGSPQRSTPHFCLLCTLAKADTLTPRSSAIMQDAGYNASSIMMCATDEVHSPVAGGEEDDRFMPVISDEIIEFSKIPFQQRSRVHALSPMRSKTYSDSQYIDNNLTSPLSPASQQPNKKFRSKSCNAASVDLDSLKKQLQFPQSPYSGNFDHR